MTRVKICGMTERKDIDAAMEMGADAIGLNLYHESPRYVEPDLLPELTRGLPPFAQKVAIVVDFSLYDIQHLDELWSFDAFQLHGDERMELCEWLKPRRVIKSFGMPLNPIPDLKNYAVDAFLLDRASSLRGGTGQTFDWSLALEFKQQTDKPIILSGGLNLENVEKAIEAVSPYAVDVCSGVESSLRKKDHAKMRDFIQLCHQI